MGKRVGLIVLLLAVVAVGAAVASVIWRTEARAAANARKQALASQTAAGEHKQLWHCGMHPQVIQDHPGDCPICHMALTPIGSDSAAENPHERKVLYWWDPMLGPSSISDHPGKSAMGMDLVPVYGEQGGPGVTIDPAVVQNMGVRTAVVARGPLHKSVRALGMLKLPEPGLHDVSLKIGGWIDKLYANQEGMHVTQGEPLFELYSQDLQVAEQELISAIKSEKTLPADASPEMRREAHGLIESARRKLRLWDVAEQDIDAIAKSDQPPRDVPFRSPATGHLEEKMVVQGSAVQPMMKLMRVADHTKMWLDAQVYQEQIAMVKLGQEVVATVEGMEGKTWKGRITFIYPHVDHMTRTLTVRMTLDNPDLELKPEMYATAEIVTQPLAGAILCPREAVIDTGERQIVFVTEGEGRFVPRKVRVGAAGDDDKVQILEGLAPGEAVVTSGQFLMDVESRTVEATQKLGAPTTNPAAATQPILTMEQSPAATSPTTEPSGAPSQLAVAYCPMVKANWLQTGESIANPYMGQAMSTCGSVQKQIAAPASGSPLDEVVQAYLTVERGFDADKLDPAAVRSLNSATGKLLGDRYGALRESSAKLAEAKDLAAARSAFQTFSNGLIAQLEGSGK